jgi:periplasmic copper chaperone A
MRTLFGFFAALIVAAGLSTVWMPAPARAGGEVRVEKPWARAAIDMSRPAAAYLTVVNETANTVTLIGVSSPVAGMAMIHKMVMDGNVMKMEPAGSLDIAPGAQVVMKPGGFHIMLMHL